MTDLIKELTPDDIDKLYFLLNIPERIQELCMYDSVEFLIQMKEWRDFDGRDLIRALKEMKRPELARLFQKLPWANQANKTPSKSVKSVTSLMGLLISKMTVNNWKIVGSVLNANVSRTSNVEQISRECLGKGLVTQDLKLLCDKLSNIGRNDLAFQVGKFQGEFNLMSTENFRIEIDSFVTGQELVSNVELSTKLRSHLHTQNRRVSVIIGKTEQTDLESIYTPLTIVKKVEIENEMKDKTSLNEISLLREMMKNETYLKKIDFDEYLSEINSDSHVSLCLIGHPGSGKTFLTKHTAFLYGTNRLNNFLFALQIPCRSDSWHEMEASREKEERKVDAHFIQNWLLLGMPFGTTWSQTLSELFLKSEGEDLLLILDGIDEFTKTVAFNTTLLCMLLQKRALSKATILCTSRPGAWNDLREECDDIIVDSEFQVLGFSPPNRDDYFRKRISNPEKQKQTFHLFFLHDEIDQLSLIPVNASLFSALFNESTNIVSETLTRLYSELFIYLIRRQLYRMELRKFAKVKTLTEYHPSIQDCFRTISEEAYWGIFHREMASDKDIPITIDNTEYFPERLGIMQPHYREVKLGIKEKIWVFSHLTLQEFMAAMYLCEKKWTEVCLVLRFLVSSDEVFILFKMVIRFTCGWLSDRAACLVPILCHNLTPDPLPLRDMPMYHQLYYGNQVVEYSDWREFTEVYCLIATMLFETNSPSLRRYFNYFTAILPEDKYLYFKASVSPNEWHCFVNSVQHLGCIQVLYIDTSLINITQFKQLLLNLSGCSLTYLALSFYSSGYPFIQEFTSLLDTADHPVQFKISLELTYCRLPEVLTPKPLFPGNNVFTGSLKLNYTTLPSDVLQHLMHKFVCLENLSIAGWGSSQAVELLTRYHGIKGLYLRRIPSLPVSVLNSTLPSLRELLWEIRTPLYEILPKLRDNTNLELLADYNTNFLFDPNNRVLLSSVISNNCRSLKQLLITNLTRVGFDSWESTLTPIQLCSNLKILALCNCSALKRDMEMWYKAILSLQSLVELRIVLFEFGDSEMWILCHSLTKHPAIRCLQVSKCRLTSLSCEPIALLIPTLPQLRELVIFLDELSSPEPDKLEMLKETAEYFSVKIFSSN